MSYYDRKPIEHLDGTPIFETPEDEQNENATAVMLEAHYKCKLQRFGKLSPLDWFANRDGRVVAVLELKTRDHSVSTYPTVYLNVRKWLALHLAAVGLGVPAIFVARFTDGIRCVRLDKIRTDKVIIGGPTFENAHKSRAQWEPLIEVRISEMQTIPLPAPTVQP